MTDTIKAQGSPSREKEPLPTFNLDNLIEEVYAESFLNPDGSRMTLKEIADRRAAENSLTEPPLLGC